MALPIRSYVKRKDINNTELKQDLFRLDNFKDISLHVNTTYSIMAVAHYSSSATTSFTSLGNICFNKFSMPFLSVTVEAGQPLHEPCKLTFTTPS